MKLDFSVVIPAYNAKHYVSQALKSVLDQKYPAKEIILVDDGSTDGTSFYVRSNFKEVTVIKQKNGGPSKARNIGINSSSCRFVAFLDADDVWYSEHLLNAFLFFKQKPMIGWFCSAFDVVRNNEVLVRNQINSKSSPIDFFNHMLKKNFIQTSGIIIQRKVFDTVGLFNEKWRFGEDLSLWVRIALQYPTIGYCGSSGFSYRKMEGSLTFDKNIYDLNNTLCVLSCTNIEVEKAQNEKARKLIDLWIEDAVYSAIIKKDDSILKIIEKKWRNRVGYIAKIMILVHRFVPVDLIRLLNFYNKFQRKLPYYFGWK